MRGKTKMAFVWTKDTKHSPPAFWDWTAKLSIENWNAVNWLDEKTNTGAGATSA
jgi:hypothetical protein